MSPKVEDKILAKLERIEALLVRVIPRKTELTEEDVLRIIAEGRREYREGKLEDFDEFVKREYPRYAHKKNKALKSV